MKFILCFFIILFFYGCGVRNHSGTTGTTGRKVTDALQRKVVLPDTVRRVVCLRSSAIRLVTYAGGSPFICGVEEQEARKNEFTHIFAHPELSRKPLIGPGMGGDPELIMAVRPDVIFMSCTTVGDADELQKRTGIPVFTIEYGDIGRNRRTFYRSLRQIAEVIHTERATDSLIGYIDAQIDDLRERMMKGAPAKKVYVGGISYKGQKGISSTDPYYAAFGFLGVDNVASQIDSAYVSPITGTYIDWEQLMDWNPDVIFVDAGGWPLVKEDFRTRQGLNRLLKAFRNKQVYIVWPYNAHHTNFEVMLANAWYAGKVLFPERFGDIDMEDKTNEITAHFVGSPISDELVACWGNYRNVFDLNP